MIHSLEKSNAQIDQRIVNFYLQRLDYCTKQALEKWIDPDEISAIQNKMLHTSIPLIPHKQQLTYIDTTEPIPQVRSFYLSGYYFPLPAREDTVQNTVVYIGFLGRGIKYNNAIVPEMERFGAFMFHEDLSKTRRGGKIPTGQLLSIENGNLSEGGNLYIKSLKQLQDLVECEDMQLDVRKCVAKGLEQFLEEAQAA